MNIIVCDAEVYKYDWLVVFKDIATGSYTIAHNNNHKVKEEMSRKGSIFGYFNGKHYDQYILKAIMCGADNAIVKEINDHIIAGGMGFEHYFRRQNQAWFDGFDIRDDMQMGLSLKAIEGHLGMDIKETGVPFDIDRPLTPDELQATIGYCKHDVDVTESLIKLRKSYLMGKVELGRLAGEPDEKSLYATNAKVTAMFLKAKPQKRYDEREYVYPPNLKLELIPAPLREFFDRIRDATIPSDDLFKEKVDIDIGKGTIVTYGYGGVHQGLNNYIEESEE